MMRVQPKLEFLNLNENEKIAGRLQQKAYGRAWKSLTRDPWLLKSIENGLTINFPRSLKGKPQEPRELSWDNPSKEQQEWLDLAIKWRAIEPAPTDEKDQIIHNLVCAPSGRLCSNTRTLNKLVKKMKIKMEGITELRQRIQKDEWVLKIDISKFYWAMALNPSSRKFFRFRIRGRLYQWRVLPFGYVNSMQIMKRLTDTIQAKLETWGIGSAIWVDDILLLLGTNPEEARSKAQKAVKLLETLGFIINREKTSETITKTFSYRGFDWNTNTFKITVPQSRLSEIRRQARKTQASTSPRALACLIGKIRYAAQADNRIVAFLVELEIAKKEMLKKAKNWDSQHPLPATALQEVHYWSRRKANLATDIRTNWSEAISTQADAGPMGYGFKIPSLEGAGLWSDEQALWSTNAREMEAEHYMIKEGAGLLSGKTIIHGTDSTVNMAYNRKIYGKSAALSRRMAEITKLQMALNIRQKTILLSQNEIKTSDSLSRIRDKTDYAVAQRSFSWICRKLKMSPTIDLFANRFSRKTPRFFSHRPDSKACRTDAFAQSWKGETIYAFPPIHLLSETIMKMKEERVEGIVIAPEWTKNPWFRSLRKIADGSTKIPEPAINIPPGGKRNRSSWRAFRVRITRTWKA